MLRVAVLVSGGGTNLQAIIDAVESGYITNTELVAVISNNKGAYALERAKKAGIRDIVVSPKDYGDREAFHTALVETVDSLKIDLIVLAGYLVVIPPMLIDKYENRIINIHPSLIPAFCGTGFYGLKVHQAKTSKRCKGSRCNCSFCRQRNRYRSDSITKSGGCGRGRYTGNITAKGDGTGRVGSFATGH